MDHYEIEDIFDQGDMITYYCSDVDGSPFMVFIDHDETITISPGWDMHKGDKGLRE